MNHLPKIALTEHVLNDGSLFYVGQLPPLLVWTTETFAEAWNRHPLDKHVIMMFGGLVETPRFQQAYGADYAYTGRTNRALPVPRFLVPLLDWAQELIDQSLNGLLLNWYDGAEHYIGPHHDSTKNLAHESPIVTVSFGETRTFRLALGASRSGEISDFPAAHGSLFVMPYTTNLAWKHSVPKSSKYHGRRISVTLRAFVSGMLPPDEYYERETP